MADRKVIHSTDAKQASPNKASYRVLTRSLMIAVVVGVVLYAFFYAQSPG